MDWINKFYSTTGKWWGNAESKITERDHDRAKIIRRLSPNARTVLELGSAYGNSAAACAEAGFDVTAVEISDRADFAKQYENRDFKGSLKVIKDDFYKVQLKDKFDVVAYWNGFGIGTDEDQRKLLKKIFDEWLSPDGLALIDIANPFVWASWNGEKEQKPANPEVGYPNNVTQYIEFDPINNRFYDSWWVTEKPEEKFTQDIRCYSPVDLLLLLEGTGLKLDFIEIDGQRLNLDDNKADWNKLLKDNNEYLVKLTKV